MSGIDWRPAAAGMARRVSPSSEWRSALEDTPRHLFVPAWFDRTDTGYTRRYGPDDPAAWLEAAYEDRSLITRVGPLHADHAKPGDTPTGRPTSSSTHPSLLLQMYEHARIRPGMTVLDVGTGSGYGTALLCHRVGGANVTTVDIDSYLIDAALARLDEAGHRPEGFAVDATTGAAGRFDRIVATVSLRPVPPAWLEALNPGGRIALTLAGTCAILTADRLDDGRLYGRLERDWAGFMTARHSSDYQPDTALERYLHDDGEHTRTGLYPLASIDDHWELGSFLGIEHPGVEFRWVERDDGTAAQLLWHADGSWARGEGTAAGEKPVVHIGGPRDLWALVDAAKTRWLTDGGLPVYGATALVEKDGTIRLRRGRWEATIKAD